MLIVEDESGVREVLAELLVDEGYELQVARNGREALQVLQRWRPDVILLDLMMPIMDGWAFRAEQLRHVSLASVPVIVLSAVREQHLQMERLGAAASLPKPFDLDAVATTVHRVLSEQP